MRKWLTALLTAAMLLAAALLLLCRFLYLGRRAARPCRRAGHRRALRHPDGCRNGHGAL